MRSIWFLILLVASVVASGQGRREIDSLNKIPFETRLAESAHLDKTYLKNAENARRIKYELGEGESYSNLALVYNYKGKYQLSTEYALKAIRVFERSGHLKKAAFQYGELGYQMKRRNMTDAQTYMRKGKKLAESLRDTTSLLSIYNNYGVLKEMQQQLDSALYFYEKGLAIKEKIRDTTGIPYSLNNIAIIHTIRRDFGKADRLFSRALQMRLARKDSIGIAENYCYYGDFHSAKKQFEKAFDFYQMSFGIASRNRYAYLMQYDLEQMAAMQENLGQFKASLQLYKSFEKLRDSLVNSDTNAKIAELEVQFETEQKEKQILESRNLLFREKETSREKNLWMLSLGILVVFTASVGFLLLRQQRLKNGQMKQEHELRSAIAKIEHQNNLHEQRLSISRDLHDNIGSQLTFIISSIDNLKYAFDLAGSHLDKKLGDISSFTRETIVELRDTIWAMNQGEIAMEEMISRIHNFMEKARQARPEMVFETEISGSVENVKMSSSQGINVYRCIQEALHNALKYSGGTSVLLKINVDNGITILVSDNGSGFDPDVVIKGNGLSNIAKRMQDAGGSAVVESSPGIGTKIQLRFSPDA